MKHLNVIFILLSFTFVNSTASTALGSNTNFQSTESSLNSIKTSSSHETFKTSTLSESSSAGAVKNTQEEHVTKFIAECELPTKLGSFRMRSYVHTSKTQKLEPIVLIHGDISGKKDVLVRVHDQCFTSEVLGSLRCDCKEQLEASMKMIKEQGGVLIYLQQEGRGIGLSNKIASYALQDQGLDTVDANLRLGFKEEQREYTVIPGILKDINVTYFNYYFF